MPTYEYECEKCGHAFEQFQQISDEPVRKCSKCGGRVRRLIGTGSGIIMKGVESPASIPAATTCGRATPCRGRDVPCETKPCD